MDSPCIEKAASQPCNATDANAASDCYESMHAFKKIRTSTSGLRKSPNKWSKEENQKLASLVANYGEKKWKRISAEMGGLKTGAQCAQHWKRVLSPEIRKGHWDENEEELLLRLVVQYGSCWKKIAKKIPQRTDIQCRYQYLKAKQSREVLWDFKEEESLIKKVMELANCSFLQTHDSKAVSSPIPCTSLRSLTNNIANGSPSTYGSPYSSSPLSSCTDMSNKENDSPLGSSAGDTTDEDRMKCSGEFGSDAWSSEKRDVNMSSSSSGPEDSGIASWRSSKEGSLNGICSHCQKPVASHVNKIVWLEISEYMARLKLTSTLRTALECKTRFNELLGNKLSGLGANSFCFNETPESGKYFDAKPTGMDTTTQNAGDIRSGFYDNIKITKTTNLPSTSNGHINLTNCNNNNITINITNSYTTTNVNQHGISFQQIASSSPIKVEPVFAKTHITPILSPAPPFPSFTSFSPSFPHVSHSSPSMKPVTIRSGMAVQSGGGGPTNGLESLAAVASILPREMLVEYAQI